MNWDELAGRLGDGSIGVIVGLLLGRLIYGKIVERLMGMVEKWNQAMLDRVVAEGE